MSDKVPPDDGVAPPPGVPVPAPSEPFRVVGRYALYREIASGGMATVHFGRLLGPVGFARTVAIKRLHPHFAKDPEFVSMFLDEARLVARIRHPNVVQTLDVVALDGELLIVMDYVQGEAMWRLLRTLVAEDRWVPPRVAVSIITGVLYGLHAAHEARGERGEALGIVHRDVSPQNILVGVDGVARVLDFGVAKAAGRIHSTQGAALKGKLAYMAPEQLEGHATRQTDIFAASIVLWEALTCERLFSGADERATVGKILAREIPPPSERMAHRAKLDASVRAHLPALDVVVLKGLQRDPAARFDTAREMGVALEKAFGVASPAEVGDWVEETARGILRMRAETVAAIESSSSSVKPIGSSELGAALGAHGIGPSALADGEPTVAVAPGGGPKADDLPSQLSSISILREPAASRRPRRDRLLPIAGMLVLAVALGAAGTLLLRPGGPGGGAGEGSQGGSAAANARTGATGRAPGSEPSAPQNPATVPAAASGRQTASAPAAATETAGGGAVAPGALEAGGAPAPSASASFLPASATSQAPAQRTKRAATEAPRPQQSPSRGTSVDSVIDTRK